MTIPEERRLVTVLFVDMVGFTRRAETTDPEEVREVQRAYFETVAAEIERYGGTVEKYIGDAVMAIFGAPRAHGDDPERALRAALAIRDALASRGDDLQIRIGVDTGEVVGGAGPGMQAGEYTVTGDAVNVAARLQQTAEPGEIVVGATTRRSAAEAFDFAPMASLELKGKAAPVEAWRLARALPERPRVRGGETPLVGRRREIALLESALDEAADGHGMLIGLSGEAGIGKSRLALEVRSRAAAMGFGTAWSTAQSYAGSFPYHLLAPLVDELLGRGASTSIRDALRATIPDAPDDTLDQWTAVLADLSGDADADHRAILDELTPEARQRLMIQALSAVLTARAAERPQLVVLDDLHWADAASLEVIDELLALTSDLPIVVVGMYRPSWTNPWSARSSYQQVNLDRLREADARQLVGVLARGDGVDDARTTELLRRSGGNPFFLEELVRQGSAGGRLPETVHELLQARIDALPGEARAVLGTASVIGTEFGTQMLSAIEPVEDLDGALAALQRDDLILPRGGEANDRQFVMRHPLVHEVAYRSQLIARRKVLHRRIGEWLEENGGEDELAAIASHYRESDDLARARHFLPLAAERAARLNAPREAWDTYLAAADLFNEPAERARMLLEAAQLSYVIGEVGRAVELISEVVELFERAGDRVRALDARRRRGRYYWMDGQGRRAEEEILAAIEGLEQLPPSAELALAYTYRAQVRMLMPDYETAIGLANRAIEIADQVGNIEAKVHALNNLGTSLVGIGDEAGVDRLKESLRLALEHRLVDDAARAYANMSAQGAIGISLFPPDEAEALFIEALEYDARTAPGGAFEQWHREGQAELWVARGRWDEAEAELAALRAKESANRYLRVNASTFLALSLNYRGRFGEAAEAVAPWIEVAVGIEDLQAYATILLAAAGAARGLGDASGAIDHLERGLRLRGDAVEHDISTYYLFEAADILSWLAPAIDGDAEHLRRGLGLVQPLADHLDATAPSRGLPPIVVVRNAMGRAARLELRLLAGERIDPAELRASLAADANALRTAMRPFDAARVELWLAEATGDADARDRAATAFTELGARPYVERARLEVPSARGSGRVAGHDG